MSKYGLELINKIKPCTFQYKQKDENGIINDNNLIHFGVIAQELNELLSENEFAIVQKMKDGYYAVNYTELIGPMIKAIQELSEKVEKLENDTKA